MPPEEPADIRHYPTEQDRAASKRRAEIAKNTRIEAEERQGAQFADARTKCWPAYLFMELLKQVPNPLWLVLVALFGGKPLLQEFLGYVAGGS